MVVVFGYLQSIKDEAIPDEKMVEINRMMDQLQKGKSLHDMENDEIQVSMITQQELNLNVYMNHTKSRVIVLPAVQEGVFYLFEYQVQRIPSVVIWIIQFIFLFVFLCILLFMLYIKHQIIKPFHEMETMAKALANRDFTYQLPQQKSKFFGSFVWAIDMMKEELRYHEQQELQLMKEKKMMILSLSHDIKTPLSNIRLYTETIAKHMYPVETIMLRLEENCTKIDTYIKEIMAANQEDLFDFTVENKEMYLHSIITLFEEQRHRIETAMIAYQQSDYEDSLVKADIFRIKEVIGNIVDNAMKYGDGDWIHVRFYTEEHHAILQIENSGIPIAMEDINSVFSSFYRGKNIRKQEGNGLGLYICKQWMKRMNGDIFLTQTDYSVSFHIVLDNV